MVIDFLTKNNKSSFIFQYAMFDWEQFPVFAILLTVSIFTYKKESTISKSNHADLVKIQSKFEINVQNPSKILSEVTQCGILISNRGPRLCKK